MRVIAYSILEQEKELLTKANSKVHDFTFISNPLTTDTMHFVEGKEVIVISDRDVLDRQSLENLYSLGVRSIITRSTSTTHIDLLAAGILKMHVANTPFANQTPDGIAAQVVQNLSNWMAGGCAGKACQCRMDCAKKSHDEIQKGGLTDAQ
ncbi:lactate dehydrogenase [Sphingobacterium sp. lm-10]|uniref:lactate dehydrogenase n=1 Tax=Sphingobacterium sp. lm-10 TaxID=2944904 RepID=UPI002021B60C|nr:lactate dehydrogenase [Sphingobacterium sp. lm-10]MCL7989341.1 lactate dehydrogenase [Sphingobacterium sp. lm-10]